MQIKRKNKKNKKQRGSDKKAAFWFWRVPGCPVWSRCMVQATTSMFICVNVNIIVTAIERSCPGSLTAPFGVLSWDTHTPWCHAPKSCVYNLLEHLTRIELLEAVKWLAPTITLSRVRSSHQCRVSSHLVFFHHLNTCIAACCQQVSTHCCHSAGRQNSGGKGFQWQSCFQTLTPTQKWQYCYLAER